MMLRTAGIRHFDDAARLDFKMVKNTHILFSPMMGNHPVLINNLIIRAVAIAWLEAPGADVSWSETGLRRYHRVNVAVAVATPRKPVTPIGGEVDRKATWEISSEVKKLERPARLRKLKPEEYQAGQRIRVKSRDVWCRGVQRRSKSIAIFDFCNRCGRRTRY